MGIVLANPDSNRVQPSFFLRWRSNLFDNNNPAPNPIAPRVTAITAISGTDTFLNFDVNIYFSSQVFELAADPNVRTAKE